MIGQLQQEVQRLWAENRNMCELVHNRYGTPENLNTNKPSVKSQGVGPSEQDTKLAEVTEEMIEQYRMENETLRMLVSEKAYCKNEHSDYERLKEKNQMMCQELSELRRLQAPVARRDSDVLICQSKDNWDSYWIAVRGVGRAKRKQVHLFRRENSDVISMLSWNSVSWTQGSRTVHLFIINFTVRCCQYCVQPAKCGQSPTDLRLCTHTKESMQDSSAVRISRNFSRESQNLDLLANSALTGDVPTNVDELLSKLGEKYDCHLIIIQFTTTQNYQYLDTAMLDLRKRKNHQVKGTKLSVPLIRTFSGHAGFELTTSELRGERRTDPTPAHAGLIRIFTSGRVNHQHLKQNVVFGAIRMGSPDWRASRSTQPRYVTGSSSEASGVPLISLSCLDVKIRMSPVCDGGVVVIVQPCIRIRTLITDKMTQTVLLFVDVMSNTNQPKRNPYSVSAKRQSGDDLNPSVCCHDDLWRATPYPTCSATYTPRDHLRFSGGRIPRITDQIVRTLLLFVDVMSNTNQPKRNPYSVSAKRQSGDDLNPSVCCHDDLWRATPYPTCSATYTPRDHLRFSGGRIPRITDQIVRTCVCALRTSVLTEESVFRYPDVGIDRNIFVRFSHMIFSYHGKSTQKQIIDFECGYCDCSFFLHLDEASVFRCYPQSSSSAKLHTLQNGKRALPEVGMTFYVRQKCFKNDSNKLISRPVVTPFQCTASTPSEKARRLSYFQFAQAYTGQNHGPSGGRILVKLNGNRPVSKGSRYRLTNKTEKIYLKHRTLKATIRKTGPEESAVDSCDKTNALYFELIVLETADAFLVQPQHYYPGLGNEDCQLFNSPHSDLLPKLSILTQVGSGGQVGQTVPHCCCATEVGISTLSYRRSSDENWHCNDPPEKHCIFVTLYPAVVHLFPPKQITIRSRLPLEESVFLGTCTGLLRTLQTLMSYSWLYSARYPPFKQLIALDAYAWVYTFLCLFVECCEQLERLLSNFLVPLPMTPHYADLQISTDPALFNQVWKRCDCILIAWNNIVPTKHVTWISRQLVHYATTTCVTRQAYELQHISTTRTNQIPRAEGIINVDIWLDVEVFRHWALERVSSQIQQIGESADITISINGRAASPSKRVAPPLAMSSELHGISATGEAHSVHCRYSSKTNGPIGLQKYEPKEQTRSHVRQSHVHKVGHKWPDDLKAKWVKWWKSTSDGNFVENWGTKCILYYESVLDNFITNLCFIDVDINDVIDANRKKSATRTLSSSSGIT
ncbi:hypothetical protein CLF_105526 [Clonorchis sinensis]|uniref:Uncharacterized protein n=1 Tax=Clonorchis sinensis TaxID=79923 RepID=G7YDN4_CLOSI|nr:hypothetical protein CLF_105526 [Clonorchis sinensis]